MRRGKETKKKILENEHQNKKTEEPKTVHPL
jgi:hypothetical protein